MKKSIFSTLILISMLISACGATNTPAPTAEPVTNEASFNTVTAEGTLLPASSAELAFAQGGVIDEILLQPRDKVNEGDVIARLIGIEAVQAELAAAELELAGAQKALNDLKNAGGADLAQAVIDLKDAKEEYDEAVDYLDYLRNSKKVPQTETRRYLVQRWNGYMYQIKTKHFKGPAPEDWTIEAENDLALHKAELDTAQRTYDRLKGGVDADQLPVLEARLIAAKAHAVAAEAALELYELRAPFDGILLRLDLEISEAVTPTQPIAFLADTSRWIVETKDLAEIDAAKVSIGDPVTVKLDAFPDEAFPGKVTEIDPVGREYLGDMTYKVTILLDEPDPQFLWNMTATVNINVE